MIILDGALYVFEYWQSPVATTRHHQRTSKLPTYESLLKSHLVGNRVEEVEGCPVEPFLQRHNAAWHTQVVPISDDDAICPAAHSL